MTHKKRAYPKTRILKNPENQDPSGTLADPTKTGKPRPGTLVGSYKNRKIGTQDPTKNLKTGNRDLRKTEKPGP